ncbi:hypothetical protein [Amycolatopsis sp. NPDC059021]|uniref:hypothetical protein n=1 Tax=Amycolatopsis sp. NPDC059021 TaxID=3346704 RepID=UPI00366A77BF
MSKLDAILAVNPGDVVQIGTSSYFHVTDVREPSHPAAPGMVWHGSYFRWDVGLWGEPTLVHMHEGKAFPHVLDRETREKFGWGDLP